MAAGPYYVEEIAAVRERFVERVTASGQPAGAFARLFESIELTEREGDPVVKLVGKSDASGEQAKAAIRRAVNEVREELGLSTEAADPSEEGTASS